MESPKPLPSPPKSSRDEGSSGKKSKRESRPAEDEEFEFHHVFSRSNVKGLIHAITQELKRNALDTEYLFLPFRPEQSNEKLLKFLNRVFPLGNGIPAADAKLDRLIRSTEPWTLFQALKYIWCRLPEGQVVTWKAYRAFKVREDGDGFRPKSFLELMPKCLSSPDHASIVYDFFDLVVTMASNSKRNKMSARKISKMFGIWAFGKEIEDKQGVNYDFDNATENGNNVNNSFREGLDQWIPASDAMFHLLLAFIRSFVPNDLKDANIPTTLKSILFNNNYPPKDTTAYASETILTIPIVSLKTTKFSKKPWQLIERCNQLFDFSNHDAFEAREDYALLKSLFKRKNNIDGISHKMSRESRRLMKEISTKHSTFQAGWASQKCIPSDDKTNVPSEHLEMKRVDIDDYFIWAWLSSISHEQTSQKKMLFGRSLILEFEFDGFKKWVALEECDMNLEMKRHKKLDALDLVNYHTSSDSASSKPRNITPAYEKFQKNVSEARPSPAPAPAPAPAPVKTSAPLLKTPNIISGTLNLPSHHSSAKSAKTSGSLLPEKSSKWNPLKSIRKISSSSSSSTSSNAPAFAEHRAVAALPQSDEPRPSQMSKVAPTKNPRRHESRVLSQFSMLNPEKYQLPTVECEDFKIDIAEMGDYAAALEHENVSSLDTPAPLAEEQSHQGKYGIEDLNNMVDQLSDEVLKSRNDLGQSTTSLATKSETFESLTMFEQYKHVPQDSSDTLAESATSSVVPPLKLGAASTDHVSAISQAAPQFEKGRVIPVQSPEENNRSPPDDTSPIVYPVDHNQNYEAEFNADDRRVSPIRREPLQFREPTPDDRGPNLPAKKTPSPPLTSYTEYERQEPTRGREKLGSKYPTHASPSSGPSTYSKSQAVFAQEQTSHHSLDQHQPQISSPPHTASARQQHHVNRFTNNQAVQQNQNAREQQMRAHSPNPSYYQQNRGQYLANEIEQKVMQNNTKVPWVTSPVAQPRPAAVAQTSRPPNVRPAYGQQDVHYNSLKPQQYGQANVASPPIVQHAAYPPNFGNRPQNIHPNDYHYQTHQMANDASMRFPPQHQRQHPMGRVMVPGPTSPLSPSELRPYNQPQVLYAPSTAQYQPPKAHPGALSPTAQNQAQFYPPPQGYHPSGPVPGVPMGGKLHGGFPNKRENRKKLHDTIKNGTFGL
ncbi:LANO_0F03114g1_1 [Lachancea nothofagi CBS 11611]|uniref:LANO_0F03114g1_1 n=1 Tax=Lachancea nothofagi CBS 11611 TaxID=1266666 RepID=A0A1G4K6Z8_9SACH|nr:LANO_0F03114g1_1 [Lachancea nothofagi CBS 11611]